MQPSGSQGGICISINLSQIIYKVKIIFQRLSHIRTYLGY
jgi:hypothetical protein